MAARSGVPHDRDPSAVPDRIIAGANEEPARTRLRADGESRQRNIHRTAAVRRSIGNEILNDVRIRFDDKYFFRPAYAVEIDSMITNICPHINDARFRRKQIPNHLQGVGLVEICCSHDYILKGIWSLINPEPERLPVMVKPKPLTLSPGHRRGRLQNLQAHPATSKPQRALGLGPVGVS